MRLTLVLPTVEPASEAEPRLCPYPGCGGQAFDLRQEVSRRLRDTHLQTVVTRRYVCRRCGRTFRTYPPGVARAHTSSRLQGIAVVLHLLGLSYGATARLLTTLGFPLGKSSVYYAVQVLADRATHLRRTAVRPPDKRVDGEVASDEGTCLTCRGRQLTLDVCGNPAAGLAVTLEIPDDRHAAFLRPWLDEVAALIGAGLRPEADLSAASANDPATPLAEPAPRQPSHAEETVDG